jgi:DNA adenine methylase
MIKSPLRYPGGKSRAVQRLLTLVPEMFDEYREPFVGGVFFCLFEAKVSWSQNVDQ